MVSKSKYYLFLLVFLSCICDTRLARSNSYQLFLPIIPFQDFLKEEKILKKIEGTERKEGIRSIILHHTDNKSKEEYLIDSINSGFLVHFIVGKDGNYYGWKSSPYLVVRAVPKMDEFSLHVSIEGTEEQIIKNKTQMEATTKLLIKLSSELDIPFSNQDINSNLGVFTHTQAKKKYGNFVELKDCGPEAILKEILDKNEGKYFSEENWIGRFEKNWIFRREKKGVHSPEVSFTNGRDISVQNKVELKELEKDEKGFTPESFRLKYIFQQKINPSCIVLHFTAISSFKISQDTLERRKLSASIMVDKDANAYQLLDSLEDMAQAATGTNQNCIQIEIVGKNTDELIANKPQTLKVANLVKELAEKFKIPLTNEKIESLVGVFSHTQAKKKFGGSVALYGKDFDPGEPYMKKILESISGTYFEEKKWFNRQSNDWILLDSEFQP